MQDKCPLLNKYGIGDRAAAGLRQVWIKHICLYCPIPECIYDIKLDKRTKEYKELLVKLAGHLIPPGNRCYRCSGNILPDDGQWICISCGVGYASSPKVG